MGGKSPLRSDHIEATDEQTFFKSHYDRLLKEREKDPRVHFQMPYAKLPSSQSAATSPALGLGPAWSPTLVNGSAGVDGGGEEGGGRGVVGPLGSTTFSLPGVERALDRDREEGGTKMSRKDSTTSNGRSGVSPNLASAPLHRGPSAHSNDSAPHHRPSSSRSHIASPLLAGAASPSLGSTAAGLSSPGTPGRGDKEALQTFFDRLLTKGQGTRGGLAAATETGVKAGVKGAAQAQANGRQPNGSAS